MKIPSKLQSDSSKMNPEYLRYWRKLNPDKTRQYRNKTKQLRKLNKQRAVEYLGGACKHCGLRTDKYSVYDFHHLDPTAKEQGIGKLVASWHKLVVELEKCILLCANCHRIEHHEDNFDKLEREVE
jgi:hypothetical protein